MESDHAVCTCHGESKTWVKDKRTSAGGYWTCRVRRREASARYGHTEKGRVTVRRYQRTDKFKEVSARYERTEKGRARQARYDDTDKGHANVRRNRLREAVRNRQARIAQRTEEYTFRDLPKEPKLTLRGTASAARPSTGSG